MPNTGSPGCAGGLTLRLRMPLVRERASLDYATYEIRLEGLQGGHSGTEIAKNRSNAILLLARVVRDLKKQAVRLVSITGGTKDNAIPNAATAVVAVPGGTRPDVTAITKELTNALSGKEDGLTISVTPCSAETEGVLSADSEEKLLNLLTLLPFGPADRRYRLPHTEALPARWR